MAITKECKYFMPAAFLLVALASGSEPPPTGTIERIEVGNEKVTIFRDDYGVPRVFAPSVHALFCGNGYAVAEDRAWQMEKYRLDAEGRLAEVFGEKFIDHDKEVRLEGMTREEWRHEFDQLPQEDQGIIQSYLDGVNRYLEAAGKANTLSAEFAQYNWKPAPWLVEDTMAIAGMMGRRFGASGTDQLRNEAVLKFLAGRLGSREAALKVFNDIAWVDDPAAISTVAAGPGGKAQAAAPRPVIDSAEAVGSLTDDAEILRAIEAKMSREPVYAAARELHLATRWGSYCWVVAPSKSVSGNAMLVGGPQMGFSTPQIAHEIQLTGAGYDVMGMGFAGIPGVLIGANDSLAWTSTSGESHNEDVFVEKLKPGDEHAYFYRGEYRPMEHRVEQITVRGHDTVSYDVYRTVHGPVIEWSPTKDVAYSKQMSYFGKEWETTIAFLGLNTAKSIQEIPPLAAKIASSHNIFVATRDGDIGFWHGGFFPAYGDDVDPRLPLRGTGEDDWKGVIPFADIPQTINPASGLIFNWNNKPGPGWKNYSVPAWGVAHHISNIRAALEQRLRENGGKLSLTEVKAVAPQIGRHNYNADWLKPGLLDAAAHSQADLDPIARLATEYLRHWDNRVREGSVAQTIFDAWYQQLRKDIFTPVLGDLGNKGALDEFTNSSAVYHALAGRNSSVPLSRDYLEGNSADKVRLNALAEALDQLGKEKGPDMSTWGYHFEWIKFDPLPSIPWYSRGTYIQVVELGHDRVHGGWILPPGQSENPHSVHYSDQLLLAGWWMYAPMQLVTEAEAEKLAREAPESRGSSAAGAF
ncbi:MAG TPA: penicillin acylase family protein [Terriglobia bacterium]|nr:penicillin acylase family protein [Terriglobia bacterium]